METILNQPIGTTEIPLPLGAVCVLELPVLNSTPNNFNFLSESENLKSVFAQLCVSVNVGGERVRVLHAHRLLQVWSHL